MRLILYPACAPCGDPPMSANGPFGDARTELLAHQTEFNEALGKIARLLHDAHGVSPVLLPTLVTQIVIGTAAYLEAAYEIDPETYGEALLVDLRANLGHAGAIEPRDYRTLN